MKINRPIKEKLLTSINTVVTLNEYDSEDYIFSEKYAISSTDMVYILQQLSKDFNFKLTDDYVDALENCTFIALENLIGIYEKTNISNN